MGKGIHHQTASRKEVKPSPYAKEIALAAAIASTISKENGRLACSDREANACPLQSRIMTPKLALPISLNWAPSKFTLISPSRGGDHRIRDWLKLLGCEASVELAREKSTSAWNAVGATCDSG